MPLPRAQLDARYRQEEVDLQPGGSTITVEAPSDNPFELADDIEVVTQASGGMAGPDPRQRSRGVVAKGNRAMPGQVSHLSRSFIPGIGEGEEIEVGLYGPVRKDARHAKRVAQARIAHAKPARIHVAAAKPAPATRGFMPGMGADMFDQMDGLGADPIATSPVSAAPSTPFLAQAGDAGSKLLSAAATYQSALAQRDLAKAPKTPGKVTNVTNMPAAPGGMDSGKIALIAGGAIALGVLAFILFKKKAS